DVDLRLCGARRELVAARAAHVRLYVLWVDRSLHAQSILATAHRRARRDPAALLTGPAARGTAVCPTAPRRRPPVPDGSDRASLRPGCPLCTSGPALRAPCAHPDRARSPTAAAARRRPRSAPRRTDPPSCV